MSWKQPCVGRHGLNSPPKDMNAPQKDIYYTLIRTLALQTVTFHLFINTRLHIYEEQNNLSINYQYIWGIFIVNKEIFTHPHNDHIG